jgi:hypothetical protein
MEFNRHIDDYERMTEDHRAEIRADIANILTVPDENARMNGLIKLMKTDRFTSLIDEFDSRVPAQDAATHVRKSRSTQKVGIK